MDLIGFVITVILLTVSGALAPGPLFFVTLFHGASSGAKSGFLFSIAHSLVEFALVVFLALGLVSIANEPIVKIGVGLVGGIFLLFFGGFQIYSSITSKPNTLKFEKKSTRKLLFTGIVFTGLNPFFIIWWLTVGANLILISLNFGSFFGVIFMYICHVWIDYVWLTSISYLAKKGMNVTRLKLYKVAILFFSAALIYFGITFLYSTLQFF